MATTSPDPASAADAPRSEVSVELRELAWTIHRHSPERAGGGPIPTTEVALLKQIVDAPGSTVGELVATLGLRQPNVSAALRSLTQRGLITREKDAGDRRVSHIRPTAFGLEEHRAISDAWRHPVDEAIAGLDPAQRDALEAALGALRAVHARLSSAR
ncbi:MarR family winged helix-turn-helix transcriptional regulator [Microbacterium sp. LRZ72]|uniref:MarR family winged helix-turn-helix transcriptional regulator n=1 Tax=Microbacterium sp. LRZ72 TaxID=2942481 RepID=UPI0029A5BE87|nr:MarR family winged helix-turn-helix transcriptional regulator [Microbacterium sp. LRZ72]MDX2376753.1 MarR family winged helix-turn-helix transcriptional regulator [Microbacterium sp. LRZ72]